VLLLLLFFEVQEGRSELSDVSIQEIVEPGGGGLLLWDHFGLLQGAVHG
jgi:hypothetical protein